VDSIIAAKILLLLMRVFPRVYCTTSKEIGFLCRDREFYLANGPFYNMIKPTSKNVPEATPRVAALSAHKGVHKEYTWDRLLPIRAALPQEATPRIADLAR